jgi:hypothetical protein
MKEIVSEIWEWFFWEIYIDEETKVHAKEILLSVFSPLMHKNLPLTSKIVWH